MDIHVLVNTTDQEPSTGLISEWALAEMERGFLPGHHGVLYLWTVGLSCFFHGAVKGTKG